MRKFIPFSQDMIFRRDPAYIVFFIERKSKFLIKSYFIPARRDIFQNWSHFYKWEIRPLRGDFDEIP